MTRRTLRRIREWFRSWWLWIPDPRIISVIVGTVYAVGFFGLGGIGTLVDPPRTLLGAVGEAAVTGVGLLLLGGSIVGMIGGALDHWELERVGIAAMGIGAGLYAGIVIALYITSDGARSTQLGMLAAAVGFLLLRLAMIWRYDYKPRE